MVQAVSEWHVLSRSRVFERFGRGVDEVVYRLPDGQETEFYIKAESAAVCVLALTGDRRVALVRQFRPGPGRVLLEMPGGFVGRDEEPAAAASRELLEETGLAGKLIEVGAYYHDAYSTSLKRCFVATECVVVAQVDPDATEFVEPEFLSISGFRELLRSGEMTDVQAGYLCLDHLGLLGS